MSLDPSRPGGDPSGRVAGGLGRDLALRPSPPTAPDLGPDGAPDPGIDSALRGLSRTERLSASLNRLSRTIRALGATSIGLGVLSGAFIWPRVNLIGLAACAGAGLACGALGLALRPWHRRVLRRLGADAKSPRLLHRTKSDRCRIGLAIGGVMLACGLVIGRGFGGVETPLAFLPAAEESGGLARIGPGGTFAHEELSLRLGTPEVREDDGRPSLELTLEITNVGATRKIDISRARDVELPLSKSGLWDNFQNAYSALERPSIVFAPDATPPSAIYPGESLRVRLVFERPIARASTLYFRVPSDCLGLPRSLMFEIDARALGPRTPEAHQEG